MDEDDRRLGGHLQEAPGRRQRSCALTRRRGGISLISTEIAELVEFTEAAAFADSFRAAPPSFRLSVDASDAYVAVSAPSVDILLFNRVMGLGVRTPASRATVDALIEKYRAAGVSRFGIQLSPAARPAEVPDWLGARDLHLNDSWTKVYRGCDGDCDVRTDLPIMRIDSSFAEQFSSVACAGFGMPPALQPFIGATIGRPDWHHYIAWADGQPAAVAALFIHGDVGWLGVATTLPAFRRRGAQAALMARRVRDGMDLGCRWFVTETGQDRPDKPNPSFHNMLRTGFKVAYHRPNFMQRVR